MLKFYIELLTPSINIIRMYLFYYGFFNFKDNVLDLFNLHKIYMIKNKTPIKLKTKTCIMQRKKRKLNKYYNRLTQLGLQSEPSLKLELFIIFFFNLSKILIQY